MRMSTQSPISLSGLCSAKSAQILVTTNYGLYFGDKTRIVVKMLCTLVISFAICWMPLQIFNLVLWLFDDLRRLQTRQQYYFYVYSYFSCHFLSIIHSLIDPLIYCFMSKNFKNILLQDISSMICCGRGRSPANRCSNEVISQTQITITQRRSVQDIPSQLNCSSLM
ncbi:unnamed protein product [Medioppia subpectinata]|uniref:G-protein coupled receptors family 1 profile domain-containing protein n=1 Tax=Medioppia subpectinata TaxID=1979941 RepID=A0A7R9KDA5_9ACAR|nr:unnamed protein product [Medioppia subpectinata]CAG2101404.1 unnamed protein product [Medioppia subpectinata]